MLRGWQIASKKKRKKRAWIVFFLVDFPKGFRGVSKERKEIGC